MGHWWKERRERKVDERSLKWAEDYIASHGYNPQRDLAFINMRVKAALEDWLALATARTDVMDPLMTGARSMDEVADMVTDLWHSLSPRYKDTLCMYLNGREGVLEWLTVQLNRGISSMEAGRNRSILGGRAIRGASAPQTEVETFVRGLV